MKRVKEIKKKLKLKDKNLLGLSGCVLVLY
jgi:hypothetical protein